MIPEIGKKCVFGGNRDASLRLAIHKEQVIVIEIGIPPSEQPSPRVFEKDGNSCARVLGKCVILQQEIIALVGSQDNLRGGVRPREQEGAETMDDLRT